MSVPSGRLSAAAIAAIVLPAASPGLAEGDGLDAAVLSTVLSLLGVLLVVAGVGLILTLRRRGLFRRLYRAQQARSDIVTRYDRLLGQARDIVILFDGTGRIVGANEAAVAAYGYPRSELLGLHARDLRDPASLADLERQWDDAAKAEGVLFETVHRRRDGRPFPVEVSSRVIDLDGEPYRQSLIRDISERRDAEAQVRRLTTAYATLAATSALIIRTRDEATLFSGICDTAVGAGGYLGAWVGMPDAATGRIEPVATASSIDGSVDGYIREADIRTDARHARGQGPTARAWREGHPVYVDDFAASSMTRPWHTLAEAFGIGAIAALPLHRVGTAVGALTLYSRDAGVFTAETRTLLEEMTGHISFALDTLDGDAARRQAEAALVAKEAELASQLDELRRWYRVMVDREERILELKEEVNGLLEAAGRPPAYAGASDPDAEMAG